jgi:hypothetical protein
VKMFPREGLWAAGLWRTDVEMFPKDSGQPVSGALM